MIYDSTPGSISRFVKKTYHCTTGIETAFGMESLFQPLFFSERMQYRLLNQKVYDALFSGEYDDEYLLAFFGYEEVLKLQIEKDRYAAGLSTFNRTFGWFQLLDRQTGEVLGLTGFHTLWPQHNRGELFYHINREENKRKGIMKEALPLVLDFGFWDLDLNRVEALTAKENLPSISLLTKFGFQYEGLLRQHYKVGEVHEDSLAFSLLREDWPGSVS
jgi:ribosomal-protein-alanine N-acetyltransferase